MSIELKHTVARAGRAAQRSRSWSACCPSRADRTTTTRRGTCSIPPPTADDQGASTISAPTLTASPVREDGGSAPAAPFADLTVPTPCQTAPDGDLWFAERSADVERAKELCHQCPVRKACLVGALERREPWGVWGGEVFVDGAVVARKRGRGRPRKDEAATAR